MGPISRKLRAVAWQEILFLVASMIPSSFAGQVIDELLSSEPLSLQGTAYDLESREALREWVKHNLALFIDDPRWTSAIEHAAALDLDRYVNDFARWPATLDTALVAGRLPCSPRLVARSRYLARLVIQVWRVSSADSPVQRQMVSQDLHGSGKGPEQTQPATPHRQALKPPATSKSYPQPQARGAYLEESVLDIFELLFRVEGGLWGELRRQVSGTQFGTDIIFRATAMNSSSTCLVECKNYTSSLSVATVAEKVLQAQASFGAEPVDHWILVSPHQDPNNELDRLIQYWNSTKTFPFAVQVWSPQSGVRHLFAIKPTIYRKLYGEDPPATRMATKDIVAEFSGRLQPLVRLPEKVARYIRDIRSFTQPNERIWLDELDSQIERSGFDEKDARLSRPLQEEILSALCGSRGGSNVALLLAEFGEGKSFFTVSLCASLQARYLAEPGGAVPVPIRLLLRGYRHVSSPLDFLRTQLEFIGLNINDWSELQRTNILVILDGLDEMSVRQDPETTRINLDNIGVAP
jgi:hypothetical protein